MVFPVLNWLPAAVQGTIWATIIAYLSIVLGWITSLLNLALNIGLYFKDKGLTPILSAAATFHGTIGTTYTTVSNGEIPGIIETLSMMWSEWGTGLIQSLPRLADGLGKLVEWLQLELSGKLVEHSLVIDGGLLIWKAVAAVLLGVYLYRWGVGFFMNREITGPETMILVALLVMVSALFEGRQVIMEVVENLLYVTDALAEVLGQSVDPGNSTVNETLNQSAGNLTGNG